MSDLGRGRRGSDVTNNAPVHGKKTFLIGMTLAFIAVIAATVLLANDRRNLKVLLEHFQYLPSPAPIALPKNSRVKFQHLTAPAEPNGDASYSKPAAAPHNGAVEVTAPVVCAFFSERGYKSGIGEPADMTQSECIGEKILAKDDGTFPKQASLFVQVRGAENGWIESFRLKIVKPPGAIGDAVREELRAVLTGLIGITHWAGLAAIFDSVIAFDDADNAAPDMVVSFKREYSNHNAFNLIVRALRSSPDSGQGSKSKHRPVQADEGGRRTSPDE